MDDPNLPLRRYWFSPSPFLRTMEWLSVVPLVLSLAASGLACVTYLHLLCVNNPNVGIAFLILFFIVCSFVFYATANIFVFIAFLYQDPLNSPEGLVSKILFWSATISVLIWILFFCSKIFD